MSKKNENIKKEKIDETPKGSLDNNMFENIGDILVTKIPPSADLVIYNDKDQLNELLDSADIVVKIKLVSETFVNSDESSDNLSLGAMQVYDAEKTEDNGSIKLIIKVKLVIKRDEFDSCSIPTFDLSMRAFIKYYIDVLKSEIFHNYVPNSHIIYFECKDFCRDGFESNLLDDARSTVMKIIDEQWCSNSEIGMPLVFFGLKSKSTFVDDEIFKTGFTEKEIKKKKKKKDKHKK